MDSGAIGGPPGYETYCYELGTLLSNYPPHFIYVHDREAFRTTTQVTGAILLNLSSQTASSSSPAIRYAQVDCIASFTARLFYEAIINTLVGWEPRWEDGCGNWNAESDIRWNDNMDSFIHGLRSAHAHLAQQAGGSGDKGKGKAKASDSPPVRIVIVVEHPERLKESLPELLVPLTRLAELSRLDLSVIFLSQVGWEDIKPPLGASPDPYYIDISSPSKEDIVRTLVSNFSLLIENSPHQAALKSIYTHFITTLCDVCFPFTHNPQELQYIAAARWPGFSKPLLDEYKRQQSGSIDTDMDVDMNSDAREAFPPPTDDVRMRLMKAFNPTLTTALEALLPRLTNAADWARANAPPDDLLALPRAQGVLQPAAPRNQEASLASLPRMSKFILIAAFLASTNPAKSDLRMFGRGIDEKKRKRRITKATGKTKSGVPLKVAQRLLGPLPFSIDRMIAILGALLEENDVDSRSLGHEFKIPGEHTDMEIGRVGVFSCVMELTSMRLLHRTTPPDRLDGPPQFKCAISYEAAQALSKELKVALNDLLWDPL